MEGLQYVWVFRRAASHRWNPEAIKAIKVTPRTPNKNCDRASTHVDMDLRRRKIDVNEDGANIAMDYGKDKRARIRARSRRASLRNLGSLHTAQGVMPQYLEQVPKCTLMTARRGSRRRSRMMTS